MPDHSKNSDQPNLNPLERLLNLAPGEFRYVVFAAIYFFFLLSGYHIIRPMRETMGLVQGLQNLHLLYMATLVSMVVLNPLFALLVGRFPRRIFAPIVYVIILLNLLVFQFIFFYLGSYDSVITARLFYVWVSVFNLFVTSLFWSTMADVFRASQSKRVFGLIGVGGTTGAIVGAWITGSIAAFIKENVGSVRIEVVLLPTSMFLLMCAEFSAIYFDRCLRNRKIDHVNTTSPSPNVFIQPGKPFAGMMSIVRSGYLQMISLFLLLYSLSSTITYFVQMYIIDKVAISNADRVELFALIDMWTNILTVITQIFLTGRIMKKLGVGLTLGILPIVTLIGFLALFAWPVLAVLVVFQICRRGSNYALSKPARESLFTVVPREDKYKAKNFIDTFIYRGGDLLGASGFAYLTGPLAWGISQVVALAAPVAGVWWLLSIWLGKKQHALSHSDTASSKPTGRVEPSE